MSRATVDQCERRTARRVACPILNPIVQVLAWHTLPSRDLTYLHYNYGLTKRYNCRRMLRVDGREIIAPGEAIIPLNDIGGTVNRGQRRHQSSCFHCTSTKKRVALFFGPLLLQEGQCHP